MNPTGDTNRVPTSGEALRMTGRAITGRATVAELKALKAIFSNIAKLTGSSFDRSLSGGRSIAADGSVETANQKGIRRLEIYLSGVHTLTTPTNLMAKAAIACLDRAIAKAKPKTYGADGGKTYGADGGF